MKYKRSVSSTIFDSFNIIFMIFLAVITIYPFWNIMVMSVSLPAEANANSLHLYTKNPNLYGYEKIFSNRYLMSGFRNSILRTVLGTLINVICTSMLAYPLSKKYLPLRNFWTLFIVFTMFFGGGLIPSYLLVNSLGLINTIWALILPGAISAWNMIIMRNFFQSLPDDLEESAKIDGANDLIILFRIVLPISLPIVATVTLWYAVGHWNAWFDSLLYSQKEDKMVLQLMLYRMIVMGSLQFMEESGTGTVMNDAGFKPTPFVIQAAAIMVTSLPIICLYPFLQKYFMKGIMVGSLKG